MTRSIILLWPLTRQLLLIALTHACTHTHTHTHAHTHIHTHIRTHTRMHTHIRRHTYKCRHASICAYTHSRTHKIGSRLLNNYIATHRYLCMYHIAITSHLPLSHLRSKEFTSVYFTYKPVIRQISYLSDHRIYPWLQSFIML